MIVEIQSGKEVLPMSYGTRYSTKELQKILTEFMFVKMQGNEIQKNLILLFQIMY